jgi:hypothetical protein
MSRAREKGNIFTSHHTCGAGYENQTNELEIEMKKGKLGVDGKSRGRTLGNLLLV